MSVVGPHLSIPEQQPGKRGSSLPLCLSLWWYCLWWDIILPPILLWSPYCGNNQTTLVLYWAPLYCLVWCIAVWGCICSGHRHSYDDIFSSPRRPPPLTITAATHKLGLALYESLLPVLFSPTPPTLQVFERWCFCKNIFCWINVLKKYWIKLAINNAKRKLSQE